MTNKGLIIAAFIIAIGLMVSAAIDNYGYIVDQAKASITDIVPHKQ